MNALIRDCDTVPGTHTVVSASRTAPMLSWFEEAILAHERAEEIFREGGDRHDQGRAWNNLGLALAALGRFEEASTAYQHDVAICAELGDHYGQAQTLANLGAVHADLGDLQQARRTWADAVECFAAVGAEDDAARVRGWIADLDR